MYGKIHGKLFGKNSFGMCKDQNMLRKNYKITDNLLLTRSAVHSLWARSERDGADVDRMGPNT